MVGGAACLCSAAIAVSAALGFTESRSHGQAGWLPPETVAPLDANASLASPQVAIDGRGNAIAAWGVLSSSGWSGALAERRAGATWIRPRPLPRPPQALATNGRGDALAAWVENVADADRVALSFRRAGGAWQPPVFVSPASQNASSPRVALDARGGALVVWLVRRAPSDYLVAAAARSPSGSWSRPVPISPGDSVELAMAENGAALLVWSQPCASVASESRCASGGYASAVVRGATRSPRGSWSRPRTLSTPGEDARSPRARANSTGAAVVVWETFKLNEAPPPSRGVAATVGTVAGRFGRPQALFQGAADGSTRVALSPAGDAVVVWSSSDRIYAASRRPQRRFGGPVPIGTGFEPEIGMDGTGAATALWTRSEDVFPEGDLFVHAARRTVAGAFGPGIDLAPVGRDCTRHRGCGSEVAVAVGADGRAIAAWLTHASGAGQSLGRSYLEAAVFAPR